MNRREFTAASVAAVLAGAGGPSSLHATPPRLELSPRFRQFPAPETKRQVLQLTSGDAQCYPLYYFIPTLTRDGRFLVYHRAGAGELQLYRLDLATAESVRLTNASCVDTVWRPWCVDSGRGVLDHRSVLNVPRNLVVYFDGNEARAVDIESLEDRSLFRIPGDRDAYGQNCCTPDGNWFVYIHVPRGAIWGRPCEGAEVVAYHFDRGEQRVLCRLDSAVFHVTAYDNEHFVVTHPAEGPGMLLTNMTSGGWELLRDGVVHCPCTERGIAYEVPADRQLGLMDPLARRRFEFPMPEPFQYIHTGWDPAGRLFLYENSTDWDRFDVHDMYALVRLDGHGRDHEWLRLTGSWPTYVGGQKAHFHPQVTPDRRWVLFTGGDPATHTCHIFLLDIADLADSAGIGPDALR
ncbi:MAG: oligogalacturonate lyase family protein [Pirellulaceae bacterium]|nr:oligogalacturonate lyase family protein [Pirellulaceae bacterium]